MGAPTSSPSGNELEGMRAVALMATTDGFVVIASPLFDYFGLRHQIGMPEGSIPGRIASEFAGFHSTAIFSASAI